MFLCTETLHAVSMLNLKTVAEVVKVAELSLSRADTSDGVGHSDSDDHFGLDRSLRRAPHGVAEVRATPNNSVRLNSTTANR